MLDRPSLLLFASCAFFSFAPSQPLAQEGPKGVAFVEAPEQGSGMCFSDNADKGFACAKDKCMKSGALSQDCLRVKWCYPAGWSADIFQQHQDGPHWHKYLCGWNSRADLEAAIKLSCEGSAKSYLIECAAVGMWSPEGKEIKLAE